MRLYVTAKTTMRDMVIDYMDVLLADGREVSLNWDESEFFVEDGVFTARYKGVYFDEEYANGQINALKDMEARYIGIYAEEKGRIKNIAMKFEDGNETYETYFKHVNVLFP